MGVGKYCTHSPNFFLGGGGGVGEEKNVCAQTGVLRAEGNLSNLFASTDLTLIKQ